MILTGRVQAPKHSMQPSTKQGAIQIPHVPQSMALHPELKVPGFSHAWHVSLDFILVVVHLLEPLSLWRYFSLLLLPRHHSLVL